MLRRDLSYLLGFRKQQPRAKREQLSLFGQGAPTQLHLGETAPYPAPPSPAAPVEPLFTGPGAGLERSQEQRPPTRRRPETYEQAAERLLVELAAEGWDVHRMNRSGGGWQRMKVPHATSPDGAVRIWFRPEGTAASFGADRRGKHERALNDARSVYVDRRGMSAAALVAAVGRGEP